MSKHVTGSMAPPWMRVLVLAVVASWLPGCVGDVGGDQAGQPDEAGSGGRGNGPMMGSGLPAGSGGGGAGPSGAVGAAGAGSSGPAAPGAFMCDPAAAPPAQAWRKLTTAQYRNTVRDLLAFALKDAVAASGLMTGTLANALSRLPPDERQKLPQDLHGSFRRLDQDVEQLHVDATYEVALGVGAALTSATRIGTVVGRCATDADTTNDAACSSSFVSAFGERALRRPLEAMEIDYYRGFYGTTAGSDPAGYADVIAAFLVAPQFLYHVEHGDAAVAGKASTFGLTAFELANRLSYQFWDTMPDNDLFAAARSGALKMAPAYLQQVDRIFKDPRSRATFDDFFRDWLKLEDLKPLDTRNGDAIFKSFAGIDLPKSTLRSQMIEDALGLVRFLAWDRNASFDDLFTTNVVTARGAELAKIYGAPVWDGMSAPPELPAGQRPGLLTRAALLATGSANTRPVMKGVFTRETVLCDEIPPPPDNAMANPPDLDAKLSTRQVVERITEMPGTACAACHSTLINPIGYATENFDALGRLRADQRLYDAKGVEIGKAAIDTTSIPQIVPGDRTPSSGSADLMRLVVASGKAHACFARHYVRYTFARWEDLRADGCALDRLRTSLANRAPMVGMLRDMALAPEFQQRLIK